LFNEVTSYRSILHELDDSFRPESNEEKNSYTSSKTIDMTE